MIQSNKERDGQEGKVRDMSRTDKAKIFKGSDGDQW